MQFLGGALLARRSDDAAADKDVDAGCFLTMDPLPRDLVRVVVTFFSTPEEAKEVIGAGRIPAPDAARAAREDRPEGVTVASLLFLRPTAAARVVVSWRGPSLRAGEKGVDPSAPLRPMERNVSVPLKAVPAPRERELLVTLERLGVGGESSPQAARGALGEGAQAPRFPSLPPSLSLRWLLLLLETESACRREEGCKAGVVPAASTDGEARARCSDEGAREGNGPSALVPFSGMSSVSLASDKAWDEALRQDLGFFGGEGGPSDPVPYDRVDASSLAMTRPVKLPSPPPGPPPPPFSPSAKKASWGRSNLRRLPRRGDGVSILIPPPGLRA